MDRADALAQHSRTTAELAAFLLELGDTREAIITTQAAAWEANGHLGVTERRETCRYVASDLEAQVAKIIGEVEARRAELADLDLYVRHSANAK